MAICTSSGEKSLSLNTIILQILSEVIKFLNNTFEETTLSFLKLNNKFIHFFDEICKTSIS